MLISICLTRNYIQVEFYILKVKIEWASSVQVSGNVKYLLTATLLLDQ